MRPGLSNAAQVPLIVEGATRSVALQMETLNAIDASIRNGQFRGTLSDPLGREALDLKTRVDQSVSAAESQVQPLQNELLRIERARANSRTNSALAPSTAVRQITIRVERAPGFDDVLRLRETVLGVYTEARASLICQIGLGFSWMDRPPGYQVSNGDRPPCSSVTRTVRSGPCCPIVKAV